eukprot:TRINITY_DN67408_c0_g1_i1.p1 TRINITY_DN67408_c0_g1~~TRINITY_DN67408_c0_g1_i1.p1  ORF type:complete len:357 (-),score=73.03 TRINITY_DN67408_c0_g1_i1:42-998(-)
MAAWESSLVEQARKQQQPMLLQMMDSLDEHVIRLESNAAQNRKLWDIYASEWATNADWVRRMATGSGRDCEGESAPAAAAAPAAAEAAAASAVASDSGAPGAAPLVLGEEWSDMGAFEHVLERYVLSRCAPDAVVAEVGSGGGRVARRVAPLVRELHCFDVSSKMLERCKEALKREGHEHCQFNLLAEECRLPEKAQYDLVYFFDVLVHVDAHTQYRYYEQLPRVLRPGGIAIVHTANLASELGWERFVRQRQGSVGGFCFVTPDMVLLMLRRAGLEILETSWPRSSEDEKRGNVYLDRDFFSVVRVAGECGAPSGAP